MSVRCIGGLPLLVLSFVVANVGAHPTTQPPTGAEEAARRTVDVLQSLKSLRFEVAYFPPTDGAEEVAPAKCRVVMATGDRVRIEIATSEKPIGVFVCDGKNVVEYDERQQTWTRYRKSRDGGTPRLLSTSVPQFQFLLGRYADSWLAEATPYYQQFLQRLWLADRVAVDAADVEGARCRVLRAELRRAEGPLSLAYVVEVALDKETSLPVRETITAQLVGAGVSSELSRHLFQYGGVAIDPKLAGDEFTFKLPEGARFVPAETLTAPPSPWVGQDLSTWNELQGVDGRSIPLVADSTDSPTIIVLWATWCVPCKMELTALRALRDDPRIAKARIVAVSVDRDATRLDRFLADSPVPFIVARDLDFAARLGWPGVPTTLVLDRKGVVVYARTGWSGDADLDALRRALREGGGTVGGAP